MNRSQPQLQWLFLKLFLVSLFLHFHTSYGERVHGEDVVPFGRGLVPPSAPNPTSQDARDIEFERVHGEDVVPLGRGPVPPSAPNPTTQDASGHP
ncbi:hypothetical protein SO802_013808 [Lithocarpus litseifolius]|uniref:Uncharacterized protein n=1 Tax=Lithocarpus litseifolius TaxID=425828 RepID=A0AAW2D6L9_9ROSI